MDIQNLTTECLSLEKHEISNAARIGIINYQNKSKLSLHKVKTHLEGPLGFVVHKGESEFPYKEIEEPHEHFIILGYSEFPSWLPCQPIQILQYPKSIQQNIKMWVMVGILVIQ